MSSPSPTLPSIPLTPSRGGIRNDGVPEGPENYIWNTFIDKFNEDDKRITKSWKEDASGILTFTGLFSAIVGTFIIEFYKKLSPDSGNQTVALLGQISQQLANFPSGNYSNAAIQPSPPSASMVWVNAMWLMSLVLSLSSALIATLPPQWARRYVETPKVPSDSNHRARVRSLMFLGIESYKTRLLFEVAPALLHLSVYLFFAGLVIAFHTINKKVAITVDVSVGLFVLAYIMLSILPCLDVICPYYTPMSHVLWYPYHIFLSFTASCLHGLVKLLHGCLVEPSWDGIISSPRQRKLLYWLDSCEKAIRKHWRCVMDGFEKSIINEAINRQGEDNRIIAWAFRLLSLSDKSKLRKLAASIPRHRILDLIRPVESGNIVLRDPLLVLLRSCEDTHATGLDEEVRKRALLVCLDTIHYISKTPDIPELNFVRVNFANIGLMRTLWDDSDTSIRVTSRSICALIARQVGRINRLEDGDYRSLEAEDLRWLEDITGEMSHDILNANVEALDRMNFKSFVYGVLSNQVGDLPVVDATSFRETLAILLDVRTDPDFDLPSSRSRLTAEVIRIHQDDPQGNRDVVNGLLSMFPFIPPPFPEPIYPSAPLLPPLTSTHTV